MYCSPHISGVKVFASYIDNIKVAEALTAVIPIADRKRKSLFSLS
jgi:hypothetical protein